MHKYAFFDVDNTIYNGYSTSGFYLFLVGKGICSPDIQTKDQEILDLYIAGKIDYTESSKRVVELQAEAILGMTKEDAAVLADEFINQGKDLFPFVKELFELLDTNGFQTYLLSASANPSIEAIARCLGTDKFFTSELEVVNNIYTGKVTKMLNNEEKKHTLHKIIKHITEDSMTFGFGDSTGDIEMLSSVDHAFVINPHQEELKQLAALHNWSLVTTESVILEVEKLL